MDIFNSIKEFLGVNQLVAAGVESKRFAVEVSLGSPPMEWIQHTPKKIICTYGSPVEKQQDGHELHTTITIVDNAIDQH